MPRNFKAPAHTNPPRAESRRLVQRFLSWNVTPNPPEIIGPWYLWKLIVDRRYQGRGYGRAIVEKVAEIVRAEGADSLLTSYALGPGNPGPFYQRVGFSPTGDVNVDGEIIVALKL